MYYLVAVVKGLEKFAGGQNFDREYCYIWAHYLAVAAMGVLRSFDRVGLVVGVVILLVATQRAVDYCLRGWELGEDGFALEEINLQVL